MSDAIDEAKFLVSAAHGNATMMYPPLSEKFPDLQEVGQSGLCDYWDYFITIASVGWAFMEIADSFETDQDSANKANAVKKALNEWKEPPQPFESCSNFSIMTNFIEAVVRFQKEGLPLDLSIGAWVWKNLSVERATSKLKEIARQPRYAELLGRMILSTFHGWWKTSKNENSTGFSKKVSLTEIEAANQFVFMVFRGVDQQWPNIVKELREVFHAEEIISDDQDASFEFVLSVIACQIQALPNLFPADQARRIQEHIMQRISLPELAEYHPRETLQLYQSAWDQCLQQCEPPFDGIASVLFDRLGCRKTMLKGKEFKDPYLLDFLSEKIVTFGGPWWKTIADKFTLVH